MLMSAIKIYITPPPPPLTKMDMSQRWEAYFSGVPGERDAAVAAFRAEEVDASKVQQTLLQVCSLHVRKHYRAPNSMFTVETYNIAEGHRRGEVMLSWWRDAPGMLLVKQAWLEPPGTEPKNVLTTAADALLQNPQLLRLGLRTVRVEAVLHKPLLLSLGAHGWTLEGQAYNSLTGNADKHMSARWCCVCGGECGEFGNDPSPLEVHCEQARCCDECNAAVVVPKRMLHM